MNKDDILRELRPSQDKENLRWDVFGKNMYGPRVKMDKWWYHREGYPKDFDAYCPTGDNSRSTYVRLGTHAEDDSRWTTETIDSLAKGRGDPRLAELIKQSQRRPMLTLLSYPRTLKPRRDLLPDEIRMTLPSLPKELLKMRYSTTYNACYKSVTILPKK